MSRSHMLYDNKGLQSIPVNVTNWDKSVSWNPDELFKLKSRDNGVVAEGVLLGKSRHLIIDKENKKCHYLVFHVDVKRGCKRRYDASGQEIQPDFSTKQKVNTGYLMSSYRDVSKEGKDVLAFKDIKDRMVVKELEQLTKEKEDSFNCPNVVSLWALENDFSGIEFNKNTDIRFRTKGDKCYLESITCLDFETKNLASYTSDKSMGGSWTDKVLAMKDGKDSDHKKQDPTANDGDVAGDDEWDD